MERHPEGLCGLCGVPLVTVWDEVRPDGSQTGHCGNCGHGFTTSALMTASPPAGWRPLSKAPRKVEARFRRPQGPESITDVPFAVFGLDETWTGSRWRGGWGRSDGILTSFELGFGDALDDTAPCVRIRTHHARPDGHLAQDTEAQFVLAMEAQGLAETIYRDGAPHTTAIEATFTQRDAVAAWDELALTLDGNPFAFRSLSYEHLWVAIARHGALVITIEARRVRTDDVRLVEIRNLEAYSAPEYPG